MRVPQLHPPELGGCSGSSALHADFRWVHGSLAGLSCGAVVKLGPGGKTAAWLSQSLLSGNTMRLCYSALYSLPSELDSFVV